MSTEQDVAVIGVAMQTDGVERGLRSLQQLAEMGPRVERSMEGVEKAAKSAGRGVSELGNSSTAAGMEKVGGAGERAAQGLGKLGQAAQNASAAQAAMVQAVSGLTRAEDAYVKSLQAEYAALTQSRGERAAFIAQQRNMSQAAQDMARALGGQIDAMKEQQRAQDSMLRGAAKWGSYIAGFVSVGATLNKITRETIAAEQQQTQLAAVLRSTGEAAGWSQARLNEMAATLSNKSTFSAGAINEAQTRLLSYTGVVGEQFPRAMQAVIDMSARMGMDVKSSAETIGRALDIPSEGLTALTRQGFRFTEEQKALVKQFEETGRTAEAQGIILDALESSYGKAADAARGTFGGSLQALQNTISDLLTVDGQSIPSVTQSVEDLNALLAAGSTKQAFAFYTGLLVDGAVAAAKFAKAIADLKNIGFGAVLGHATSDNAGSELVAIESKIAKMRESLSAHKGNWFKETWFADDIAVMEQQLRLMEQQRTVLSDYVTQGTAGYGGLTDAAGDYFKAQQEAAKGPNFDGIVASALNATKGYKSQAEQMAEVRKQGDMLRGALKQLEEGGRGASAEADQLRQRLAGVEERMASMAKRGAGGKKGGMLADAFAADRDAAKTWAATLQKAAKGIDDVQNKTLGLNAAQSELLGYLSSPAYATNTEEMRQMALAKLYAWDAAIKHADAVEQEGRAIEATDKAIAGWTNARAKDAASLDEQIKARQEEIDAMGLSAQAVAELAAAKYDLAAAAEEEYASNLRAASAYAGEYQDAYLQAAQDAEAKAQKLRTLASKERTKGEKKAAKEAADAWEHSAQDIERELTSALMRGFESGKDFAENLRDTMVNIFKTTVLQPVIKAIVQPVSLVINGLTQTALQAVGLGGNGGILGLANNASTLNSAYSLYNGGFSGLTAPGSAYYNFATSGLGQSWGLSNAAPIVGNNPSAYMPAGTQLSNPFSGASAAGWTGAAAVAVAALIANAAGIFRSDRPVGGGLRGTLGKGDIRAYELWREGGTLFDGPNYSINDREGELARQREALQRLMDAGEGGSQAANFIQQRIDFLQTRYGPQIEAAAQQGKALDDAFIALRTNTLKLGDVLGLSTDHLKDWTTTLGSDIIHPDTGGVGLDFTDLDQEGVAKKIQEALETANNQLAEQLIGAWVTTTETVRRVVETISPSYGEDQVPGQWDTFEETITRTTYVQSEYAREGERAIDTLTRLATSLSTVNGVFDTLGLTMLQASLASGDLASRLVDMMGGLEGFQAASATYYQNFYSEDERRANAKEELDKQLDALGLERIDWDAPDARQRYRELVEREQARMVQEEKNREQTRAALSGDVLVNLKPLVAGDIDWRSALGEVLGDPAREMSQDEVDRLNGVFASFDTGALSMDALKESVTDIIAPIVGVGKSGAETTAALLGLSGAAAAVTTSAEQAAEAAKQQAEASRRAAEEAEKEAERKRQEAIRSAYDLFRRAVDRDRDALQDQASGIEEIIGTISSAVDLLKSNARELYGTVDSTAQMLAAQGMVYIEDALAGVRSGKSIAGYDGLADAIEAARGGVTNGAYASQFERDRDALVLAGQLSELGELGDSQLSVQERQLKAINEQIEYLDNLAKRADDLVNGTAALTGTVESYFSSLLSLLGVKGTAGGGTGGGGAVWGGTSPGATPSAPEQAAKYSRLIYLGTAGVGRDPIRDEGLIARLDRLAPVYHAWDGTGDLVGLAEAFKAAGGTVADLSILSGYWESDWIKALAGVGIPAFAVGTNYVPRDMVAQIHQGEAIVPKAYNPWAGGQGMQGGNAELLAEVRALREDNRAQAGEIVRLNSRIAKLIERWDGDGLPQARQEALA